MPDASNARILLVTNDFGPRAGGIETFVIGLLERMPHDSTLVYASGQGETRSYDQEWLERNGTRVIRDRASILLPTPRVIRQVLKVVEEEKVTHIWFGAAAPLALMMPMVKRRFPLLRSFALTHGHEVWWAKIPPFSILMRIIGASLDGIGFLAEYTRREISKGLRSKDRGKLVQIAPGIDTELFRPVEDESTLLALRDSLNLRGKRIIISVGRLVHRKGQDRLIEALPQLKAEFPDLHLIVVGTGPYESHLRNLVNEKGLNGTVTFVGRLNLEELPRYLSLAEIFAMPSRDRLAGLEVEGLGIVYLEASSCALPVIVGRSGGAPDALIDGETGLLVDGTDIGSIARACRELLSDPLRSKAMGAKGREWITSQWSWDRWAEEFQDVLLD